MDIKEVRENAREKMKGFAMFVKFVMESFVPGKYLEWVELGQENHLKYHI